MHEQSKENMLDDVMGGKKRTNIAKNRGKHLPAG